VPGSGRPLAFRRAWHRFAAALSAAVLLAAGCSAESSPEGDEPAPTPTRSATGAPTVAEPATAAPLPPAPRGLSRFYRQDVDWRPCADGFECTTVRVPLDYSKPGGDTVDIAVNRRPADDPDRRIGAMLVNPGGPGVSGITYAPVAAQQFSGDVLDRYDIVGFSPRGVATSEGVDCLTDAELDRFVALDPTPDDDAAVAESQQKLVRFGQGCVDGSGALAGHISTPEAARDMDVIRSALGSPKLHYYGASYGTLLGSTYADLFPDRVGAMVLDGAIDASLSATRAALQQAKGFQTAVDAYLENCVDQGDCPLGDTVPAAQDGLNDVLAQIDAEPIPAGRRTLTVGHAVLGTWLPLYVPELWPQLTAALQAANEGKGGPLLRLADLYVSRGPSGYQDNSIEALYAVNCLDHPTSLTAARVRRLLPRFRAASPVFGDVFAWGLLGCPQWPARAAESIPKIDAPGAPPIMVVGTTGDPATPYESAVALANQLRSGVLVTRVGEGHTGFARGNACVDDVVNEFFAERKVPEDGLRC
jgi:pimeloyl-ACP methyl ester carboxylesterase